MDRNLCACVLAVLLFAAMGGADEQEETRSILDDWREALLYGIDDDVVKVVEDIRKAGESALNIELAQALRDTPSDALRQGILAHFQELEDGSVESIALRLLEDYEELDAELVRSATTYLAAIGSKAGAALFEELIDYDGYVVAVSAIKALGQVAENKAEVAALMLEHLADDEYDEKIKPDLVLALGELGDKVAVDPLIALIEDREQEKVLRMYAATALGQIGDEKAIPSLKGLYEERDALTRAYAAAALARFPSAEATALLSRGLKDSYWRVRLVSIDALADRKAVEALDILLYKARKDPARDVRKAAFRALGEIGQVRGLDLLREIYLSEGESVEMRLACLDVLADKDLGGSLGAVKEVIEKNLDKDLFQSKILEQTARKLARVSSGALEEIFGMLLRSRNLAIRVQAIRGIALNKFGGHKQIIETMVDDDPAPGVRKEALAALEKW